MEKIAVYGLPLNPLHMLDELAGASFCVSFATRVKLGRQLDDAIRLVGEDQILLIDNGAFSHYRAGGSSMDESYLDAFEAWALEILDRCPQAIAVIPDVIGGTAEQNAELLRLTQLPADRSMAIWHLDEPIEALIERCIDFAWIGFGSAGDYWKIGTPAWHARIAEAFAAIDRWEAESDGAYVRPRIHMMRAQSMAHLYPFDSSDSTNVAINHGRYKDTPRRVAMLAARVNDRIQASAGEAAEHQVKRPLLEHVETAAWRRELMAELALEALAIAARKEVSTEERTGNDWRGNEGDQEAAQGDLSWRRVGRERGLVGARARAGARLCGQRQLDECHGAALRGRPAGDPDRDRAPCDDVRSFRGAGGFPGLDLELELEGELAIGGAL